MHIVIVSGMLGVGKTSTVLKLIDQLIEKKYKVAIIENEFGSKGVDGETIRKNGMEVRELKGGCVCCTMKSGMVDTLRFLESNVKPDVVIVEPSGIADPQYIISVTEDLSGVNIDSVKTIIVTDAERFSKILTMFKRPLKNQLYVADLVLLNKIDTRTSAEMDEIETAIRSFSYDGKIIRTQAEEGTNMNGILEHIGL